MSGDQRLIAGKLVAIASLVIGIAVIWLAMWIYLPAPTYFFLAFGVTAPELSHWLIVLGLLGGAVGALELRHSRVALAGTVMCAVACMLALGLWVRVPAALQRFDAAMRRMSTEPRHPMRRSPIVFADLFRPIPHGITRRTVLPNAIVYRPEVDGSYPVVVQLYGGGWKGGAPGDNANFAAWLASSGYVVIAIDYRHAPAFRWPAQIDDVNDALRWVAAHAGEYGGDTSRVVLVGRSAGAHLATHAAWFTSPIHVRGVVSLYGPADLVEAYRHPPRPDPYHTRSVEEGLLGGSLDNMPARYRDASTTYRLADVHTPVPPTLLIYGGRDHIVEAKYGAALEPAIAATGAPVAYLEIPWAEHAFDVVFNGPSSQISLYYIERFIAWATAVT